MLLAALALTVGADSRATPCAGSRRERTNTICQARRRQLVALSLLSALALNLYQLWTPIAGLGDELARMDLRYLREHYGRLLPDLRFETLIEALRGAVCRSRWRCSRRPRLRARCVPWWSGSTTFQHSHRLPERPGPGAACARRFVGVTRLGAAVLRGVPEVNSMSLIFRTGVEAPRPMLHGAGVLARVFADRRQRALPTA